MEELSVSIFHVAVLFLLFKILGVLKEVRDELKKGNGWYSHTVDQIRAKHKKQS